MNSKLLRKVTNLSRGLYNCPDSTKRHFSFLVIRNKVISTGWNKSFKTHPLAKKYNHRYSCTHSELDCILNAEVPVSALGDYTMINVRLDSNKNLVMSKPCKCCQAMLADFGINNIIYSTTDGFVKF